MVLLIQVPLKQKNPMERGMMLMAESMTAAPMATMQKSDVEAAVIGHGEVEGPYTEIDGLDIERDPRFPIRVTVQFYKATSNGAVSQADMAESLPRSSASTTTATTSAAWWLTGRPSARLSTTGRRTSRLVGGKTSGGASSNTGMTREEAIVLLRSLRAYAGHWLPFRPVEEPAP
jgi:hypothetical protein